MAEKSRLILSLDANQLKIYLALLDEGMRAFAKQAFELPPAQGQIQEHMLHIVDFGIEITNAIKQQTEPSGPVQIV